MTSVQSLILLSGLLALTLLVLVFLLTRTQRLSQQVLLHLLMDQRQESQSLRNQLRAADPMTLHSLQYATQANPSQSNEEYVPSYEEGLVYQSDLAQAGYKTEDLSDDLVAGGWDPLTTTDSGGSPVAFERP